jgi:aminoglycoside phosphotransferase (APT) family kinase protein
MTRDALWNRRLRDLIGHGEGIMGLADSYPLPLPYVDARELQQIEALANDWRWRLKPLSHRLCQVHGDFHPFNVIFDEQGQFHVLDRSRGAWGEAADDVSCLAINYLFFSLQQSGRPLAPPFSDLYRRFWETYLRHRRDDALQDVIAPWFAWRALVVASPVWYPNIARDVRRKLLTFARRVMLAERFDWQDPAQYMEPLT